MIVGAGERPRSEFARALPGSERSWCQAIAPARLRRESQKSTTAAASAPREKMLRIETI